ncbi:MAG: BrnT family toxin [Proteobacteria bacterium]|nr:BrnT family toxin [Pseudomonadota bacterium]MBU1737759.1 BrnT family toxin [Pseudomonadota bacterium]
MKYFNWNTEKNEKLREDRGVSFEEAVFAIEQGQLLDILEHPNKEQYENQMIFVVKIFNYVWLIPFVEDENEVFLKTIIPSRKATRQYLHGGGDND